MPCGCPDYGCGCNAIDPLNPSQHYYDYDREDKKPSQGSVDNPMSYLNICPDNSACDDFDTDKAANYHVTGECADQGCTSKCRHFKLRSDNPFLD